MVALVTGTALGVGLNSGFVLGSRGQIGTSAFGRFGENVTINASTGNLYISRTDEILIGVGPDSTIVRSYNSLGVGTDDNGDNWQLSMQRRVANLTGTVNTAGSTVTRYGWDGSSDVYTWDATVSAYVSKAGEGAYDRITFASNVWTWTDGNSRVVETYDNLSGGRITATKDSDGNSLTYQYDASSHLRYVVTSNGEYTEIVWSGNNIAEISTNNSSWVLTRTRYTYDSSNRLSTVTTDLTPDDRSVADGNTVVTTYTYDGTSDRIKTIEQTGGAKLEIGYTLVGSAYRVTSYTQTLASGVTSVTTLSYDTTNRITTVTDDLGQVTKITYGTSYRLAKVELPPAQSGAAAQIIQYAYNGNGDVISTTDAAGNVTTYTYDGNGNMVDRYDPDGTRTNYSYNSANQLVKSTVIPSLDGLTTLPTLGVDVEYYLATYGDIAAAGNSADPVRHFMTIGWTEGRDPNAVFDTSYYLQQNADVATGGSNPLLHYLQFGWREGRAPSATATTAEFIARYVNQSTRYVYDSEQHLRFVVSPEGRVTEYRYNAAGQQTSSITYPQKSYNVGTLASTATLSESTMAAWVTSLGDLTGSERTDTSYNHRGDVATVKSYSATDSAGVGAGTVTTVTYAYDQYGNMLFRQTSGIANSENFVYDGLGRITSTVDLNGGTTSTAFTDGANQQVVTLANGLVETSLYDLAGNLISRQTAGSGLVTAKVSYSYDDLGRLRSVSFADNPADATPPVIKSYYLYDAVGRKVADVATDGAITEYGYDARDRLITTIHYATRMSAAALASLIDSNGRPANVTLASIRPAQASSDQWEWRVYDIDDRLLEVIDGAGGVVSYTYDELGKLVSTTSFYNKFTSALAGFKTTPPTSVIVPNATAKDAITRYFYDNDGNLLGTLDALGYFTQNRYDNAGRKLSTTAYANLVSTSLRATGSFDEIVAGIGTNARDIENFFVYNASGQLKYSLNANLRPTEYKYDSAGNLLHTFNYGTSIAAGSAYTESYVAGQITSLDLSNHADTRKDWLVYNDAGLLAYSINADGGVTSYSYDNRGQLIKTVAYFDRRPTGADQTRSAMDSWVSGHSSSNNRVTRYYYDAAGRQRYVVDPQNYVTRTDYDLDGRVQVVYRYDTPYAASNSTTYAIISGAALGAYSSTHYTYDPLGRLKSTADALNMVTMLQYDALDRVTDRIIAYGTGDAATTHYTYDAVGNVKTETLGYGTAESSTITYGYDGLGNMLTRKDGLGYTTTYTYDTMGNVLTVTALIDASTNAVTSYSYDGFGNRISTTDPRGFTTYSTYDLLNHLIWQVDAEGYVTRTGYTIGDEVAYIKRYAAKATVFGAAVVPTVAANSQEDATTAFTRDKLGRVTKVTDAMGGYEEYTLNAFGDRIQVRNKLGGIITNVFDRRGLLLSETLPMSSYTNTGVLQASNVTNMFEYDARGNRTKLIEAAGLAEERVTSYEYDKAGRLTNTTKASINIASDDALTPSTSKAQQESIIYDRRGNVRQTISVSGASTYFYYDTLDRKIAQVDPSGMLSTWTYDANGNTIKAETSAANRIGRSKFNSGTEGWSILYDPSSIVDTGSTKTFVYNGKALFKGEANASAAGQTFSIGTAADNRFAVEEGERLSIQAGVEAQGVVTALTLTVWWFAADGTALSSSIIGSLSGNQGFDTKLRGFVTVPAGAVRASIELYGGSSGAGWGAISLTEPIVSSATGSQTQHIAFFPGSDNASSTDTKRSTSFSYDRSNRLVTSTVSSVRTGYWNGSTYVSTASANIVSTNYYDAAGNIIRQTDGRGGDSWFYYDKLGRKVAEADQGKYLTSYALDADGNVTKEERFATALSATLSTGSDPAALRNSVIGNGNDRITTFTYDRNGNRLTESRQNVSYRTVDTAGALSGVLTGAATVRYQYNGLGQVVKKVEATGVDISDTNNPNNWTESLSYNYDVSGRLINEISSAREHYAVPSVQHTQHYNYDGLNQLVRSVENSERETRYEYDKAGHLTKLRDAAGLEHFYDYDVAGNMVRERYSRVNSAGAAQWEAKESRYDTAGRSIAQSVRLWNGSTWQSAATETRISYNAFGEVSGKGIASGGTTRYYETYDYDRAGRIWRSTAGDGVIKLFLYDQNGNQTALITSSGANLPSGQSWSSLTTDQAVALLTNNGTAALGTVSVQGMVVTITAYDLRGQVTETREALRETTAIGSNYSLISKKWTYNAFGEIAQEIDARGNVTDFAYNTIGKVVQRQSPTVSWTAENGAQNNERPIENYFYDLSGRLVGVQDANGNVNTRTLLSGSGYGDEEALVLKEFHADGGILSRGYDGYGSLKVTINEVGAGEWYNYDALGRLTSVEHEPTNGAQLIDYYGYDILGQRVWHYNSLYGSSVKETTDYDGLGRITSTVDLGGNMTSYAYSWIAPAATSGLGTVGGWRRDTTNSAGRSSFDLTNYFGQMVDSQDFGGHNYDYGYDGAGHLISKTSNTGESVSYSYYNTGLMAQTVSGYTNDYYGSTATSSFRYDVDGNRTFEGHVVTGTSYDWGAGVGTTYSTTHQQATVTWDAMNRMTSYVDAGTSSSPVNIQWEYDLTGNIRHMRSVFRYMDAQGVLATTDAVQDYWYKYDSMNRFVTTKGTFTGSRGSGSIVKGSTGTDITYDASGRRATATSQAQLSRMLWQRRESNGVTTYWDEKDPESMANVTWTQRSWAYTGDRKETYSYTSDGYLQSVSVAQQELETDGTSTLKVTGMGSSLTRVRYIRDTMGRVTDYSEYSAGGYVSSNASTNRVYQRLATYDSKSQVTSDTVTSIRSDGTWVNSTIYSYNATEVSPGVWQGVASGGTYMGGVVTRMATSITKDGAAQTGSTTTNSYQWWGGALQSRTNYDSDSTHNTSNFYYDESGHLTSVYIQDGRSRTVTFINDANGQILQRDEVDTLSTGDPRELHFYFNGLRVGDISNNGTSDVDYVASITQHTSPAGTGPFRNGAAAGTNYADFDQSYDPINGLSYESAFTRYTVQAGDTLEGIAQAVWGDASFWYMIADANGLSGAETLIAGMSLVIPNKVHNSHNNADTYKVYDPNEAIGDTMPTAAKPPRKNKCGAFGQILMVAVAVAVTVVTSGAAAAAAASASSLGGAATSLGGGIALAAGGTTAAGLSLTAAGMATFGAIGAVAGAVVSQGVGLAIGAQSKFSWKGAALAAFAGGLSGGLAGTIGGGGWAAAAGRGALGNVLTQGIAVASGLQGRFDWAGVATAGLGAGLGQSLRLPGTWGRATSGMAAGLAAAAGQSLITGDSFGDTLMRSLPSIIGNTIGNLVASEIAQSAQERAMRRAGVERSASAFEERFGDTAEVAAYREAGLAAAKHPGSREARANFDQAARLMLEANSGDADVAAFLNHINPDAGPIQLGDIAVTGSRDYLLGSTIDNAGIWVGEQGNAIKQGVGQFIQDHPGVGTALTLADGAFAVVAPGKYLAGMALDYFKDEATGFIADKMTGPQMWSVEKGQAGGSGFVLAGSIALGGLGALRGAGSTVIEARGGTYVLRDADGAVVRTGRTKDLERRRAEHARDPNLAGYKFDPVHRTDDYVQQRGLEQILHDQYNPQLNKIRPISPSNKSHSTYMDAAQKYLLEHGGP